MIRTRLLLAMLAFAMLGPQPGAAGGSRVRAVRPSRPRRPQFGFGEREEQRILAQFDKNRDRKLDASERKAALAYLGESAYSRGSSTKTPKITPSSVRPVPASTPLYDPDTLRTLFLDFEDENWERELMAFKFTDIQVPATLTVDGKTYKDVAVKFRGNSSFFMVPEGQKHSLNISLDEYVKGQSLMGYTSLKLLNSHADPSFLHAVLYLEAARELMPAPKANFVRVVINGESWGIYPNIEQINPVFFREAFSTEAGSHWKVPGSPRARAGLEYWGDEPDVYKGSYEIKGKDDPKAWARFVELTRILNTTSPEKLEAALANILDVDGALRFLAVDNTLVNNDGYWVRASDFAIYLDPAGKFHMLIYDVNEAFGGVGGGFPMESGPAGPDPLIGLGDPSKPLRSKLLAVPALRAKYLDYSRQIAGKWLNWKSLEPILARYRTLISAEVKADNRKIYSFAEFENGPEELKAFADLRGNLILNYRER